MLLSFTNEQKKNERVDTKRTYYRIVFIISNELAHYFPALAKVLFDYQISIVVGVST